MKTKLFVLATAIMSLSCSQSRDWGIVKIDENSTIIDVRTAKEYRAGHLENAINIPYTEIPAKIADHVKNREDEIVLYCRSGRRSGIAKKTLTDIGYECVVNAGAYAKLKEQEDKRQKETRQ
ncbi:MAG: rhodanese-like domain-containing protein [Planctomycetota bacterium]|jgi:phage shock protein E